MIVVWGCGGEGAFCYYYYYYDYYSNVQHCEDAQVLQKCTVLNEFRVYCHLLGKSGTAEDQSKLLMIIQVQYISLSFIKIVWSTTPSKDGILIICTARVIISPIPILRGSTLFLCLKKDSRKLQVVNKRLKNWRIVEALLFLPFNYIHFLNLRTVQQNSLTSASMKKWQF